MILFVSFAGLAVSLGAQTLTTVALMRGAPFALAFHRYGLWAAGGGSFKTPSTTTPGTTTPGKTTPRADHNCPHMGNSGSSSSNGAAYAPSGPMNL